MSRQRLVDTQKWEVSSKQELVQKSSCNTRNAHTRLCQVDSASVCMPEGAGQRHIAVSLVSVKTRERGLQT